MTGPEHYAEAERLTAIANDGLPQHLHTAVVAEAQVHATLALAAATVDAQRGGTAVWAEYPAPVEGGAL